jgi:hypothetical protein
VWSGSTSFGVFFSRYGVIFAGSGAARSELPALDILFGEGRLDAIRLARSGHDMLHALPMPQRLMRR